MYSIRKTKNHGTSGLTHKIIIFNELFLVIGPSKRDIQLVFKSMINLYIEILVYMNLYVLTYVYNYLHIFSIHLSDGFKLRQTRLTEKEGERDR